MAYIIAVGNYDEITTIDASLQKVYIHINTLLSLYSKGNSEPSSDFSGNLFFKTIRNNILNYNGIAAIYILLKCTEAGLTEYEVTKVGAYEAESETPWIMTTIGLTVLITCCIIVFILLVCIIALITWACLRKKER